MNNNPLRLTTDWTGKPTLAHANLTAAQQAAGGYPVAFHELNRANHVTDVNTLGSAWQWGLLSGTDTFARQGYVIRRPRAIGVIVSGWSQPHHNAAIRTELRAFPQVLADLFEPSGIYVFSGQSPDAYFPGGGAAVSGVADQGGGGRWLRDCCPRSSVQDEFAYDYSAYGGDNYRESRPADIWQGDEVYNAIQAGTLDCKRPFTTDEFAGAGDILLVLLISNSLYSAYTAQGFPVVAVTDAAPPTALFGYPNGSDVVTAADVAPKQFGQSVYEADLATFLGIYSKYSRLRVLLVHDYPTDQDFLVGPGTGGFDFYGNGPHSGTWTTQDGAYAFDFGNYSPPQANSWYWNQTFDYDLWVQEHIAEVLATDLAGYPFRQMSYSQDDIIAEAAAFFGVEL